MSLDERASALDCRLLGEVAAGRGQSDGHERTEAEDPGRQVQVRLGDGQRGLTDRA